MAAGSITPTARRLTTVLAAQISVARTGNSKFITGAPTLRVRTTHRRVCRYVLVLFAGSVTCRNRRGKIAFEGWKVGNLPTHAAGNVNRGGADEAGIFTGQEQRHTGNVFRFAITPERYHLHHHGVELLATDARSHFLVVTIPLTGIDPTHVQAVDQD